MLKTIGILSPGEMGSSIARVLRKHGAAVVTCLEGRSQRTRQRAGAAGIMVLPTPEEVVRHADLIVSVVVPSAALDVGQRVARAIAATGKRVLFADANAISPMTSIAVGHLIAEAGGEYADVSIIGSAKSLEEGTVFYASGQKASELTGLRKLGLEVVVLGEEIGQASALKMVYAGLTKGISSLAVELLVTARAMNILDQVLEKYQSSHPEIFRFMTQNLPGLPPRAARRSEEMQELAATIEHYGLTPVMAEASARVLKNVGNLGLSSDYSEKDQRGLKDVVEQLYRGIRRQPR